MVQVFAALRWKKCRPPADPDASMVDETFDDADRTA